MKLSEVLQRNLSFDPIVNSIQYDSRKVSEGALFFAVPGFVEDGAKYLPSAFAKGAVAAVVKNEADIPKEWKEKCIEVSNVREALADASFQFYGKASSELGLYGLTGTKGKTTSSYILESILNADGKKMALLGTVECKHPGKTQESTKTTMEALELQKFLREAIEHGANNAVLEVSSHALSLDRVRNCEFRGVSFTNLQEDHLDFYGDMEKYFEAKKMLFQPPYVSADSIASICIEDKFGARLAREASCKVITYGKDKGDVFIKSATYSEHGTKCVLGGKFGELAIEASLLAEFNLLNIVGICALSLGLGIDRSKIQEGIKNLKGVPGRMERVESKQPFSVFVDFAHNGYALEKLIGTIRALAKGRIIVVFGAGGDRPMNRRIQMAEAAARLADFSVITSDNPRTEDPMKIIDDIRQSFVATKGSESGFVIEPDRQKAIRVAIGMAQPYDLVCIVGKGHETGQIIGTKTFPFDDRIEAAKILQEL